MSANRAGDQGGRELRIIHVGLVVATHSGLLFKEPQHSTAQHSRLLYLCILKKAKGKTEVIYLAVSFTFLKPALGWKLSLLIG